MTVDPRPCKPARLRWAIAATPLLALGLGAGCGEDPVVPPPPAGSVSIQLDHQVGADGLRFGSRDYVNAAGNAYSLFELRYFVSNLELVRGDGSAYKAGGVHLRDAAVPDTRVWRVSEVPDGHYVAVRFTFGLDAEHNRQDGLPATIENLRMEWPEPLGDGYHFMMLDGFFADSTGADSSWMAHLGRLVSMQQPTPVETAFQVELPIVLHVAGNAHTVPIVMDVNAWFASPHVYDFDVYGGFNMDDPEALLSLHDNGAHVFEIGTVAGAPHR
jgi:hypothetical protein